MIPVAKQRPANNQRRKAHSLIYNSSRLPMFPFDCGPDKLIPHYQRDAMETKNCDNDVFITIFLNEEMKDRVYRYGRSAILIKVKYSLQTPSH